MSLTKRVDEVVDFVRKHPDQMTRAEVDELHKLAEQVYVLAFTQGLADALPQVSELVPQLKSSDPRLRPVQFESKVHLPGDWDIAPPHDSSGLPPVQPLAGGTDTDDTLYERAFLVCASPHWFNDMRVLRTLAEAQSDRTPLELLEAMPDETRMTCVDLAKELRLKPEPLRSRLKRWRKDNFEGWHEINEPKARQSKYLYEVSAVRHVLRDALAGK